MVVDYSLNKLYFLHFTFTPYFTLKNQPECDLTITK